MDEINVVLTIRDEEGREWLAGAALMPMLRYEGGQPVEELPAEALKDRAFTIQKFTVVARADGED